MTGRRIALAGSSRSEPDGAVAVGDLDPNELITVTVYLKRRSADEQNPEAPVSSRGSCGRSHDMSWPRSALGPHGDTAFVVGDDLREVDRLAPPKRRGMATAK